MDSVAGNLKQVDDIVEAMVKGKAAVQAALIDRLDFTDYQAVILN